jgi:hypothetical protein
VENDNCAMVAAEDMAEDGNHYLVFTFADPTNYG